MKKSTKAIIIAIIAIMVMIMAAVPASAASSSVKKVSIAESAVALKTGESEGLRLSVSYSGERPDVEWQSSNSKVATVSENGKVTANKAGTATIKVTVGDKTDTCKVKVTAVDASKAYTELNKYRKAKKMKALKRDARLEKIAAQRAKEMAETGKFSHTRPNGKSGLTLITNKSTGRKITAKGENIAMGQTSAQEVTRDWYNSKGHRENMLRKQFNRVGIAAYTADGITYWAQVFSN